MYQAESLHPWQRKREEWKSKYTFTEPITISTNCQIDAPELAFSFQRGGFNGFYELEKLVANHEDVEEVLKVLLGSYNKLYGGVGMPFFIDEITVSNVRQLNRTPVVSAAAFSLELPFVKHTNTLPYRVINEDRYRCIDLTQHEGEDLRKCHHHDNIRFFNGQPHQVKVDLLDTNDDEEHVIVSPEMRFVHHVDYWGSSGDEDIGFEPSIQMMRANLMHAFEMMDHQNVYPTDEPVQMKQYDNTNSTRTVTKLPGDSYVASWWASQFGYDQMMEDGVIEDLEVYSQYSHDFFAKYSKARAADWKKAGLFISFQGTSPPQMVTFDLTMKLCFIVVNSTDEMGSVDHSALMAMNTVRKNMKSQKM